MLYEVITQMPALVAALQPPARLLTTRAGDCRDASLLAAASLEHLGLETVFVVVPEHMVPAVVTRGPGAAGVPVRLADGSVITSYSIHYTKLYEIPGSTIS